MRRKERPVQNGAAAPPMISTFNHLLMQCPPAVVILLLDAKSISILHDQLISFLDLFSAFNYIKQLSKIIQNPYHSLPPRSKSSTSPTHGIFTKHCWEPQHSLHDQRDIAPLVLDDSHIGSGSVPWCICPNLPTVDGQFFWWLKQKGKLYCSFISPGSYLYIYIL